MVSVRRPAGTGDLLTGMIAGMAGIIKDVPPYMMASGIPARVIDVNIRGLRRAGVPAKVRLELRAAYKLLFRSNLNQAQALQAIEVARREHVEMARDERRRRIAMRGPRGQRAQLQLEAFGDAAHFATCLTSVGLKGTAVSYCFGCATGVRGMKPLTHAGR